MVHIVNVVIQGDLHADVDLEYLATYERDVKYNPRTFSGAILKNTEIGGCCLIFKNGKMNCNGNKSVQEAQTRIKQYADLIGNHGFCTNIQDIKVISMTGVYQLSGRLDFDKLCKALNALYEPEIHNATMLKRGKVHYNCFHTGKVVITGIKDTEAIYPTLLELEMCTVDDHVTF